MGKLISMTDFVLEQAKLKNDTYELSHVLIDYANFLKQPLTLGMFVPCDLDGNVLEESSWQLEWEKKKVCSINLCVKSREYQEAKDRVLFEGFEIKEYSGKLLSVECSGTSVFFKIPSKDWYTPNGFELIENLVKDGFELTESAKKQIFGL